jgi:OOP family OmpA-OmpF porin
MKTRIVALTLALALVAIGPSQAQDIAGARDFQGIPRFQGSKIIGYQLLPYDGFRLPTGPVKEDDKFEWQLPDAIDLEGKVTGYVYMLSPGKSALEVFRNYQGALTAAGFETLFKCESAETCGNDSVLVQKVYADSHIMQNSGLRSAQAVVNGGEIRFLSAKRSAGGQDTYVSLAVAKEVNMGVGDQDSLSVVLHVIEPKAMDQSMVFVDATKMANDIGATGHVALYGIYFDTGSAEIKAESEPTLGQIATLLKQDQNRKVAIVGHTDTVGGFDFNMSLSGRRSRAVVDALTRRYGIPGARLHAAGVGYLAPVASNESEQGRAKNRRVELVQE